MTNVRIDYNAVARAYEQMTEEKIKAMQEETAEYVANVNARCQRVLSKAERINGLLRQYYATGDKRYLDQIGSVQ